MNQEDLFKLQAYLDGELPSIEQPHVADWLNRDPQARAIHDELRSMKALLAGNELELPVPETREFYWSKIERAIQRESVSVESPSGLSLRNWWLRLAAPLAGAALLILGLVLLLREQAAPGGIASYFHEIETPVDESEAISFHSEEAGITVIWIASR